MAASSRYNLSPLDLVLVEEVGQLGLYQLRNLLLLSLAIATHAVISEFNFSAAAIPTRFVYYSYSLFTTSK